MDELMRDREALAGLRAVRGVIDLDRVALYRVAAMHSGESRIVEAVVLNLESAQVSLKRFEADRDRERRIGDQDVVYRFTEIRLPMLELGVVQLLERVRKIGRLMT